jgi:hypothetical protein
MNRAGVPELELRYLTGHTTGDILNEYVTLDPEGAMAAYFRSIGLLLEAIATRAMLVLGVVNGELLPGAFPNGISPIV